MSKKKRRKKPGNPPQRAPMPRTIPFQEIPSDLQPLAIKITKLEKGLLTTKNALDMNFDHLIDLLVDLKKTSMDLIKQAKMMEKAVPDKEDSKP